MAVEADFPGTMLGAFIIVSALFGAVMCRLFRKIPQRHIRNCFIAQWVLTCISFVFLYCITGRRRALPAVLTGNADLTIVLCALCWGASILLMLAGCLMLVRWGKLRKEE